VVPALANGPTQDDWLFDVVPGVYYGHPNPSRGKYVLNGGNPTGSEDFAEVVTSGSNGGYPVGIFPDVDYQRAHVVHDFGRNRSPDGAIEYLSAATFRGRLANSLLVIEYSGGDDVVALSFDSTGQVVPGSVIVAARGLTNPLDLTQTPSGALFVTELITEGAKAYGRIRYLAPTIYSPPETAPLCTTPGGSAVRKVTH
jgi:hypothetical protein